MANPDALMAGVRTLTGDEAAAANEQRKGTSSGLGLPLFTNLSRQWELDAFKPFIYKASIFYMNPASQHHIEKPYFFNIPVEESWQPKVKQTNVCYTRKTVAVADIRRHQGSFSMDIHGFQLGILHTSLDYDDFSSDGQIVTRYYQEVKDFLINYLGALDVLPFDFQVLRLLPIDLASTAPISPLGSILCG
jgi:hypothetical protein